jgi:type IV secretion system protein TrbC
MENTISSPLPKFVLALGAMLVVGLLMPDMAYAAGAGGGNMPWNAPLTSLSQGLIATGFVLIVIGLFVIGTMLVFAHEWGRFANSIILVIVAGALMVGGGALATTLGVTGAVV